MCSEPSSRMSFTGRILSAFLGQWSHDAGQGVAQCGGLVLHKSFLRMVVWICRTYENVEREAALAPGLRDFFRSCAVWRLTKMDRIFPSTGVRVRSLRFAGRRGRGTVRCVCVKPLCVTLVVLLAGFFWILFRLFHNRPFGKLKFPRSSLPTLLFDDEGVSRGARAPAACSVVLPTIVIARSLRLESGGR